MSGLHQSAVLQRIVSADLGRGKREALGADKAGDDEEDEDGSHDEAYCPPKEGELSF